MTRKLIVGYAGRVVGELRENRSGGGDVLSFCYSPDWLAAADAFPVSLSLPLTDAERSDRAAHAFFANLLPEGRVRTLVARRLGLSEDNDFALLAALGGECAGALTLTEDAPPRTEHHYRPLPLDRVEELARSGDVFSGLSGTDGIRLSLAGAQDKLPIRVERDGSLSLPLGTSPSTHLLKFAHPDFKHLPANEAFVTSLAGRLGLPSVSAERLVVGGDEHLLVRRYDRVFAENGRVERLHQEDFCQALGHRPTRKYEEEGGPDLGRCADLLLEHSAEPALDLAALLRWTAFNAVVGNADGHAKNLAVLRRADGRPRLAPFYDLVSTAIYPRIDRRLAMRVGSTADPGEIRGRDWRALAKRIGVGPTWLVEQVREITEAALTEAEALVGEQQRDSPAPRMILPVIRKRARRLLHLLAE